MAPTQSNAVPFTPKREMSVRDLVRAAQAEMRATDLQPQRARELLHHLTALIGNVNHESREADMAYNVVLGGGAVSVGITVSLLEAIAKPYVVIVANYPDGDEIREAVHVEAYTAADALTQVGVLHPFATIQRVMPAPDAAQMVGG